MGMMVHRTRSKYALAVLLIAAVAAVGGCTVPAEPAPDPAPAAPSPPLAEQPAPPAPTAPPSPPSTPAPTAPPPSGGAAPTTPPAKICGSSMLNGPATPPAGAVVIPAGDNSGSPIAHNWTITPNTTYWFAPGVHTLDGDDQFSQIIPADGNKFVGAPGAVLDGQGVNLYAFTGHASNVSIEYLTIRNFAAHRDSGVVNHDFAPRWRITHSSIVDNRGAGVILGDRNVVADNCLANNGQYGFQVFGTDATLDHNEIAGNNVDDWETKLGGCGCTGGGKMWDARRVTVTNNWVHDNRGVGLWADTNNVGVNFEGNYIADNYASGILYETSYNARIANNTFLRNGLGRGPTNPGFPEGAIYLSESGGDPRVNGGVYSTLEVSGNVFTDNWSGIIVWENADRYCNSPSNTSTGYCTLGGAATLSNCVAGTINREPYYSDCRWKSQNISVQHNQFSLDPTRVPGCKVAMGCGYNGIFSNYGTQPSWSPYKGTVIETAITFNQKNVFSSNKYVGPWQFVVKDQGTHVDFTTWRNAPYHQDAGSTKS
jgi:hypothetical protein